MRYYWEDIEGYRGHRDESGMGWVKWALQTPGRGHQLLKPSTLLILSVLVFPHFCLFVFCCCFCVFFKNYLPSHTAAFFYPPVILWSGMLHVLQHVYGGQRTALELVLSFYHTSPKQGTQVLGLGSKNPYLQSHLAGPSTSGFWSIFKVLALSKPHPEND